MVGEAEKTGVLWTIWAGLLMRISVWLRGHSEERSRGRIYTLWMMRLNHVFASDDNEEPWRSVCMHGRVLNRDFF